MPEDMHYIVQKFAKATVRDGAIVLFCVREDGRFITVDRGTEPIQRPLMTDSRVPGRVGIAGIARIEEINALPLTRSAAQSN